MRLALKFFNDDEHVACVIKKSIQLSFKQKCDYKNMERLLFNIIKLTEDDYFKDLLCDVIAEFTQTDNYKKLISDATKGKSTEDLTKRGLLKDTKKLSKPAPKMEQDVNSIDEGYDKDN